MHFVTFISWFNIELPNNTIIEAISKRLSHFTLIRRTGIFICMEIMIQRLIQTPNETTGMLSIDGKHFCFTMEDEHRDVKKLNETRIPSGRYSLIVRTNGGMHKKYTERYGPKKHKGMLWLQDVPGFEWIYIHVGNYESDTSGCILTGFGLKHDPFSQPMVTHSTPAYLELAGLVYDAIDADEQVWVTINDQTTASPT